MIRIVTLAILMGAVAGCVVEPGPVAPAGVAYVGPTYAVPGPGYYWRYHPHYGWGWWHARYGWHRGWR